MNIPENNCEVCGFKDSKNSKNSKEIKPEEEIEEPEEEPRPEERDWWIVALVAYNDPLWKGNALMLVQAVFGPYLNKAEAQTYADWKNKDLDRHRSGQWKAVVKKLNEKLDILGGENSKEVKKLRK